MNTLAIFQILDGLLLLVARVPALVLRVQAIRDELGGMVAEGREPTEAEWEEVGTRIDDRLKKLGAA